MMLTFAATSEDFCLPGALDFWDFGVQSGLD